VLLGILFGQKDKILFSYSKMEFVIRINI